MSHFIRDITHYITSFKWITPLASILFVVVGVHLVYNALTATGENSYNKAMGYCRRLGHQECQASCSGTLCTIRADETIYTVNCLGSSCHERVMD